MGRLSCMQWCLIQMRVKEVLVSWGDVLADQKSWWAYWVWGKLFGLNVVSSIGLGSFKCIEMVLSVGLHLVSLCYTLFVFVQFIVMFDHVRSIWTHLSQTARDCVDHASAANDSCTANLGRGSLVVLLVAVLASVVPSKGQSMQGCMRCLKNVRCLMPWQITIYLYSILNPPSIDRWKRLNGTNQNEQRLPCRVLADLGIEDETSLRNFHVDTPNCIEYMIYIYIYVNIQYVIEKYNWSLGIIQDMG